MVPALVLTAGLATRLRPLSLVRAKAALPVAGRPLIVRILQALAASGVSQAVLNLHYLAHTLTGLIGDGSALGVHVRYSWEVPVLGSAGGPARALPLLGRGTFLIVNGDTLTDLDVTALLDDHRRSGALVTMAVVPNREPDKYGGVRIGAHDQFEGWVARGSGEPSWHFIGVQAAEPAAFASVSAHVSSAIRTLYPDLTAVRSDAVRVYRTDASFSDIGTPADYLASTLDVGAREGVDLTAGARVAPTARVERSVLWEDVVIDAGVQLQECIVTDGVRVPAHTSWNRVTIRRTSHELCASERQVGDLAIAPL
jgi:NDP-sugar pyrophosphorylase family protein